MCVFVRARVCVRENKINNKINKENQKEKTMSPDGKGKVYFVWGPERIDIKKCDTVNLIIYFY